MLTEMAIKSLKAKSTPYKVADTDGLCIEVAVSGSKLWRWRYRFNGKEQMLALGKYPAIGLAEARRKRDEARALLEAGKHPTREKKAKKLRKMAENDNTFEKTARRWMDLKCAKLNAKYAKISLARLENFVFPHIGSLPITEITIPDIVKLVEHVGIKQNTPETARRVKQLISQIFRYATQRGICQHNPAADLRDILPIKQVKHYPCIPPAELPDLLNKMHSYEGGAVTKAALHLIALTFVRTNELITAKWSEIDWDRQEWHIPKERMKMRRPHVVPLSRQAVAVLKELYELTGHKDYIFHSQRGKTKHISNGAVLMALKRMGYAGRMTGHGFRSLASTILNEKGYSPDWIEAQLAHADADKIRSAYNRAEYLLERKKMMQFYADYLDAALAGGGKVITAKFKKRA
jgi:integrase